MTVENSVRLLAGIMILISLAIYQFWTPYGLLLTVFVGLNLIQSSFTNVCLAEVVIRKLKHQPA